MRHLLPIATLLLLAAPLHSQDDPPTLQQGRALLQQKNWAGAEKVFRAITKSTPENARAWYLLGYSLHAAKRYDEALVAHRKAATFAPTRPGALYNAACCLSLLDRKDEAITTLGRAREAGFANRGLILSDKELAGIRTDARFAALVPPLLEGDDLFVEKPRILHTFVGEAAQDQFGWVARTVGDLDGDGVTDFATTAPSHARWSGRIYVYSSKKGKLLFKRTGKPGQRLGNSVAPAGDVNGDGTPDVLAGAPGQPTTAGRCYVFSGKDGAVLLDLTAGEPGDNFGLKCCGLGDIDGDGKADVLVGASKADGDAGKDSGRGYAFGATGKELFRIEGEAAGDNMGSSCDACVVPERRLLVVGAPNAGVANGGRAYVYRISEGRPVRAFTIEGTAANRHLGQYFTSILGDVDGDGVEDVYAADFSCTTNGGGAGAVYVHSGKTGKRLLTLDGKPGENLGTSPSQAGDVDGDGLADLVIGAWQNREGAASGGKVYVHSGKDGALLEAFTCRQAQDTFGFDAQGIGDVDGDGGVDFLLTSAWSPVLGPRTGRVFIVAGSRYGKK